MDTLETKVAVLEREITQIQSVFSRLDVAIEKIGDVSNCINKMLAVHDEKLDHQDKINEDIYRSIEVHRRESTDNNKELHSRITTVTRELEVKIADTEKKVLDAVADLKKTVQKEEEQNEKRIRSLESSKYIMIGIGTALGFIFSKALPTILALFK
jgi:allophanate hydrolase subunit 1